MALLPRYDTPAFLPDFNGTPGQLEAWSRAVSTWFDEIIKGDRDGGQPLQFFNAETFDPGGLIVEQAVMWNAFPKEMVRRFGRDRALVLADRLWPYERYGNPTAEPDDASGSSGIFYRPQEEYCEWHVLRDADSGKILRATFTSEPPEYWQALSGLVPGADDGSIVDQVFPGNRDVLLSLYQSLVSPQVRMEDLFALEETCNPTDGTVLVRKGAYNMYNRWNTTHGIAHLNSPPNSLVAEIKLGADATLLYTDPDGRLLVEPDALIAYAGYGGANRNSDPTIGATVNALARLGAYVTLRNPVGLYMDHVDLSGWRAPDGGSVSDCIRIVRGLPGMVERMVVEAPPGCGFDLGDVTIAGQPLRYGGQIAECITVKLVGLAAVQAKPVVRAAVPGPTFLIIDPAYPSKVSGTRDSSAPPGTVVAYAGQGSGDLPAAPKHAMAAPAAFAAVSHAMQHNPRKHR